MEKPSTYTLDAVTCEEEHPMDKRIYKDSEKLAHLNRAAALVASGTDTIRGYLKAEGIPYATFYGWKRRLANHTGHDECTPLVALGRPERATIPMAGIVVDYCGALLLPLLPSKADGSFYVPSPALSA